MSLVFSPLSSEKIRAVSFLVIRVGIAFVFIWAGFGKASDPAGFGMMLQNMAGIDPLVATNMALLIGILELTSGVLVLIGFLTRPAAIFQIVIIVGAMVMFGFDFTTGPAIWKDPTILGVAIGLLLYGSGKFGIDYLISKR
jgi:putative oxidoreductase